MYICGGLDGKPVIGHAMVASLAETCWLRDQALKKPCWCSRPTNYYTKSINMQVLRISISHSTAKIGAKAKSRVTLLQCGEVGAHFVLHYICASLHDIVGYTS